MRSHGSLNVNVFIIAYIRLILLSNTFPHPLNSSFWSCITERSHGGNGHMGAAHSDTSQGEAPQLFFFFPNTLLHLATALKMFCDFVCVLNSLPVYLSERLSRTESASCGCSGRMCCSETIVKEPRWQETRLRKTKISVHFLTTSFHFLPVGSILFL